MKITAIRFLCPIELTPGQIKVERARVADGYSIGVGEIDGVKLWLVSRNGVTAGVQIGNGYVELAEVEPPAAKAAKKPKG